MGQMWLEAEGTQWRVWTDATAITYNAFGGVTSMERVSRSGTWARGGLLALWMGVRTGVRH